MCVQKNEQGLKIARLYEEIGEHECATMYLDNYLAEFVDDDAAWQLRAEIAESMANWSAAIKSYTQYTVSNNQWPNFIFK